MSFKTIVLFISMFAFLQYSYCQDTLKWSPSAKLQWQNFKATPDSLSLLNAVSKVSIKYSFTKRASKLSYTILCFFNEDESWVKTTSDTALVHEQGHFDIGEIFARRFRKELTLYTFISKKINEEFGNIAKQIKEEEAIMNSLYDKETDFHRDSINQKRWNEKIANELFLLQVYE